MAKKSGAQLGREIEQAMKAPATRSVRLRDLFGWRPKLEESVRDVDEGRVSRSSGDPLLVSRLDSPRGAWMIVDGYHRAIEAILAERSAIDASVSPFLPRIERAGGAYREYVLDKANVRDFVRSRGRR